MRRCYSSQERTHLDPGQERINLDPMSGRTVERLNPMSGEDSERTSILVKRVHLNPGQERVHLNPGQERVHLNPGQERIHLNPGQERVRLNPMSGEDSEHTLIQERMPTSMSGEGTPQSILCQHGREH